MNKTKKSINRLFLIMMIIYFILLFFISSIACYYAYNKNKQHLLSTLNIPLSYMQQEYIDIIDNFWRVYMPIYQNNAGVSNTLQNYFSHNVTNLTPFEEKNLSEAMQQMLIEDSRIQWIGLFSDFRQTNYVLSKSTSGIQTMNNDFPYLKNLSLKSSATEIYGTTANTDFSYHNIFAICGNAPTGSGKIIVGYSLNEFVQNSKINISDLSSVRYYITDAEQIIFDSDDKYITSETYFPQKVYEGIIEVNDEKKYVKSLFAGSNTSFISYTISRKEFFIAAHKDTPLILSISIVFFLLAFAVHYFIDKSVSKEVSVIQEGLRKITRNNFDSPLPTDFQQTGLPEIAENINEISRKLDANIKRAYYFEIKQRDAQLAELQATFNPHFLYNTLEMLRSKSYANGDSETADLISQFSSLFRSFIGAKTFITIKEELAFCGRYLTILNARYGNVVHVHYDISSELLNYGIIRNVFQLIIENYFIHGLQPEKGNNRLWFIGKSIDTKTMLFQIEDNGIGMSDLKLSKLNQQISEPIRHGEKSYGLKNLNQRLKIFYGPDCGLTIFHGQNGGLCIQIKLLKIGIDDYQKQKLELDIPDEETSPVQSI